MKWILHFVLPLLSIAFERCIAQKLVKIHYFSFITNQTYVLCFPFFVIFIFNEESLIMKGILLKK